MTRLFPLVALSATCALTATLVLPGFSLAGPVQGAPEDPAESNDSAAELVTPHDDVPRGAGFDLDDSEYRGGALVLRTEESESPVRPVFRFPDDSTQPSPDPVPPTTVPLPPPEGPVPPTTVPIPPTEGPEEDEPIEAFADPAEFSLGLDRAADALARTQPYSFAVTAISGGELEVSRGSVGGGPPLEPYDDRTSLISIGQNEESDLWAFDVDQALTTKWTATPDPALGDGDPESEDTGSTDGADDEGSDDEDAGIGGDDGNTDEPGTEQPDIDEPSPDPQADTGRIMCIALESRGTAEQDGGLAGNDGSEPPARTVMTLVFGGTGEVEPCADAPAKWEDQGYGPADLPPETHDVLSSTYTIPESGTGGGFHRVPGLDLTGQDLGGMTDDDLPAERWARVVFRLDAAPDGSTATYRNASSEDGWFYSTDYNERAFTADDQSAPVLRPLPTRDAHAAWSFSESGTYCVAVGVHTTDDPAEIGTEVRVEPEIVEFDVGGGDEGVDCTALDDPPGDIVIPPPGDDPGEGGPGEDQPGIDPPEDGSGHDDRDGMPAPGDRDRRSGGADDRRGSRPTPTPTSTTPATRVQQAPPVIRHCPAEVGGAVQVRDGRVDFTAAVDDGALTGGFVDHRGRSPRNLGTDLGVVVPATATRSVSTEAGALGEATDSVWSTDTGRTGVPHLGWDFTAIPAEDVGGEITLNVDRVEGPGGFAILDRSSGSLLADTSQPLSATAGERDSGVFAFERPGDYTVTFSMSAAAADGTALEPVTTKINFAVGDENSAVAESPMLRALVNGCGGMHVGTDLMDYTDPGSDPQAGPEAVDPQGEGVLGDQWWIIAGLAMGLAALLGIAVLVVLMRESRR